MKAAPLIKSGSPTELIGEYFVLLFTLGTAVAQEVEQLITGLVHCLLLSTCQRVLGQDSDPRFALDEQAHALHGSFVTISV